MLDSLWFAGWILAVFVLFGLALSAHKKLDLLRHRLPRGLAMMMLAAAVVGMAIFANLVLLRHEVYFDFTAEHHYTADAAVVAEIEALNTPVQLTYFFRDDDPSAIRITRILKSLARQSPYLTLTTVDPDAEPSLARSGGVRFYNAALLEADGRRIVVQSTDEIDIGLGIARLLRQQQIVICFLTGHGEYPIYNNEFHTHVESLGIGADHSHGVESARLEISAHGVGRWRQALETIGYETREILAAMNGVIDKQCDAVIDAGPRSAYSDVEIAALMNYLGEGGDLLLLYDLHTKLSGPQNDMLKQLGMALPSVVLADAVQHYANDPNMVAVTSYEPHPLTRKMSFTFFPGVRPVEILPAPADISAQALLYTSPHSTVAPFDDFSQPDNSTPHIEDKPTARTCIAGVSRGRLRPQQSTAFRVIIVGDSDFATNSFFPYMSNNRLILNMTRWLVDDLDSANISPRIPAPPRLELSRSTQRRLFFILVVGIPAAIVAVGVWIWHRRRQFSIAQ